MKTLLFAVVAAATLGIAAPASAQPYLGAGPGGVGVQVGPFAAGVGPAYDPYWGPRHRWHDAYAYAGACRIVRERIVTPSGRRIIRTHRVCD
jgi:hypothetical protein